MTRVALDSVYCPRGLNLTVGCKDGRRTGIETLLRSDVDALDWLPEAQAIEVRVGGARRVFPVTMFESWNPSPESTNAGSATQSAVASAARGAIPARGNRR